MKPIIATVFSAAIFLAACSPAPLPTPTVSPAPSSSTAPSSTASAAVGLKVRCDRVPDYWLPADASGSPIPVTLMCDNAVAAAEAAVGADPGITSIEFHYFFWCRPGVYCSITTANNGHVIFHLTGLRPDILVQVWVDEAGGVAASSPQPFPSPSS
ncbi:MAG: hypothetical protein E6J47_06010 [Chloroflexi bacterium]|nr:MAG: hypothetical protein E6J47_06010 [Chloroflexota bacterium]